MNEQLRRLIGEYCEAMGNPDVELGEDETYSFSFDDTVVSLAVGGDDRFLYASGFVSDMPAVEEEAEKFLAGALAMNTNASRIPGALSFDAEFNGLVFTAVLPLENMDRERFSDFLDATVKSIEDFGIAFREKYHIPVYEEGAVG